MRAARAEGATRGDEEGTGREHFDWAGMSLAHDGTGRGHPISAKMAKMNGSGGDHSINFYGENG